jgi:hypothetical protein
MFELQSLKTLNILQMLVYKRKYYRPVRTHQDVVSTSDQLTVLPPT